MINKIEFSAKNLTSNAGLFLLLEYANKNGVFDLIDYIKEAKYDMAVGHLLLQSFWANEVIFQLMMMAYNLFLLFKMDFAKGLA